MLGFGGACLSLLMLAQFAIPLPIFFLLSFKLSLKVFVAVDQPDRCKKYVESHGKLKRHSKTTLP